MSENQDFHNKSGLFAFTVSFITVLVFFIYLVTLNKGVILDEKVQDPPSAESASYNLATEKAPWASSENVVKAGAKLFAANCVACHGAKGDTVGGLPGARNLVEGKWTQGDGIINHFKVLQNGITKDGKPTQMMSFKANLKPYERWAILNFIETITQNKSKDKLDEIATFAKSAE